MGSGASFTIPQFVDLDTYRQIAGSNFSETLFHSFGKDQFSREELLESCGQCNDVYVSHCCWAASEGTRCVKQSFDGAEELQKIVSGLKEGGLKVHCAEQYVPPSDAQFDADFMEHRKQIDRSLCVVVVLTKEYVEALQPHHPANGCRFDFSYAMQLKEAERVVGVVLEDGVLEEKLWSDRLLAFMRELRCLDFAQENLRKTLESISNPSLRMENVDRSSSLCVDCAGINNAAAEVDDDAETMVGDIDFQSCSTSGKSSNSSRTTFAFNRFVDSVHKNVMHQLVQHIRKVNGDTSVADQMTILRNMLSGSADGLHGGVGIRRPAPINTTQTTVSGSDTQSCSPVNRIMKQVHKLSPRMLTRKTSPKSSPIVAHNEMLQSSSTPQLTVSSKAVRDGVSEEMIALKQLTALDVSVLLEQLNMAAFKTHFIREGIDGERLAEVGDYRELQELGVSAVAKAKALMRKLKEFKVGGVPLDYLHASDSHLNKSTSYGKHHGVGTCFSGEIVTSPTSHGPTECRMVVEIVSIPEERELQPSHGVISSKVTQTSDERESEFQYLKSYERTSSLTMEQKSRRQKNLEPRCYCGNDMTYRDHVVFWSCMLCSVNSKRVSGYSGEALDGSSGEGGCFYCRRCEEALCLACYDGADGNHPPSHVGAVSSASCDGKRNQCGGKMQLCVDKNELWICPRGCGNKGTERGCSARFSCSHCAAFCCVQCALASRR